MLNKIVDASKIFDSTIRLQILASLYTSELTYTQLKKVCRCADGAMTNHTNKLADEGYISVKKEFVNKKPRTTYTITDLGREKFREFINVLNQSIQEE